MYRTIVADDHPATRRGIKASIEKNRMFKVVAEVKNGKELKNILDTRMYDLIILDINMPDMDGLQFLKMYRKQIITKKVIIYSMHTGQGFLQEALANGINGYILKNDEIDELDQVLLEIMNGGMYVSPNFSDSAHIEEELNLTHKQKRILHYLMDGKNYTEIAESMGVSYRTIEFHAKNLKDKFQANDLIDLLNKARNQFYK
ncbi:MAG: response regulator transcription factor [Spirochaetota bacterium]